MKTKRQLIDFKFARCTVAISGRVFLFHSTDFSGRPILGDFFVFIKNSNWNAILLQK